MLIIWLMIITNSRNETKNCIKTNSRLLTWSKEWKCKIYLSIWLSISKIRRILWTGNTSLLWRSRSKMNRGILRISSKRRSTSKLSLSIWKELLSRIKERWTRLRKKWTILMSKKEHEPMMRSLSICKSRSKEMLRRRHSMHKLWMNRSRWKGVCLILVQWLYMRNEWISKTCIRLSIMIILLIH